MAPNESPVVALLIRRPLESQRLVQIRPKPSAPRLDHHLGRDELVVRRELDVVVDPVERQHQVQFVYVVGPLLPAILDRSPLTLAHLVPVVEVGQLVRVECPVLVHPPRDQEFRLGDVSRVSDRRAKAGKPKRKLIKGNVPFFFYCIIYIYINGWRGRRNFFFSDLKKRRARKNSFLIF